MKKGGGEDCNGLISVYFGIFGYNINDSNIVWKIVS